MVNAEPENLPKKKTTKRSGKKEKKMGLVVPHKTKPAIREKRKLGRKDLERGGK